MLSRATRILTLLVLIAGPVALAVPATAATVTFTFDGIEYTVDDANVAAGAAVTDYTGGATTVQIPGTVELDGNAYDVVRIGDRAFDSNGLTSVAIPDSVTSIGFKAFYDNDLTSIDLPDGLTAMGAQAFDSNELGTVAIPNSLTTLPTRAFYNNHLTSVDLSDNLTALGDEAFANNQISSVAIPDGVTALPYRAFYKNHLTSIDLPDTLTMVGQAAFSDNALTTLVLPDSVATVASEAFANNDLVTVDFGVNVTTIGQWAFSSNSLTTLDLPDTLTSIANGAFRENQLTSVTIPAAVTSIGPVAFKGNASLTSVTFAGPPPTITAAGDVGSLGTDASLLVRFYPAYAAPGYPSGFTEPTWQGYQSLAIADVTVTFDLNGHGDPVAAQHTTTGETATEPPAPTEAGWSFDGWFTDPDLETPYDFDAILTGDVTLYAGWTEVPATDPGPGGDDGGTGGSSSDAVGGNDSGDSDSALPDTGNSVTATLLAAAFAVVGAGVLLLRRRA